MLTRSAWSFSRGDTLQRTLHIHTLDRGAFSEPPQQRLHGCLPRHGLQHAFVGQSPGLVTADCIHPPDSLWVPSRCELLLVKQCH